MKPRLCKASLFLAAALSLSSLSSCYFNSAQHLIEEGSRDEAVFSAHITPGFNLVYHDGRNYYVELPRYKVGKDVRTQYSITDMSARQEIYPRLQPGKTIMVRIPHNFAMYLVGKASGPKTPDIMEVVQDETIDKSKCKKYQVKQSPAQGKGSLRRDYVYRSPYMPAWYTLGACEWMCVDVPVTCVENSLMLVAGILWPPLLIPESGKEEDLVLARAAREFIPERPVQVEDATSATYDREPTRTLSSNTVSSTFMNFTKPTDSKPAPPKPAASKPKASTKPESEPESDGPHDPGVGF